MTAARGAAVHACRAGPGFAEPWFQELNADVKVIPVMSGDDVQKGIATLG